MPRRGVVLQRETHFDLPLETLEVDRGSSSLELLRGGGLDSSSYSYA